MRTQSKLFATAILLLAIVPACKFNCSVGGTSVSDVEENISTNDKVKELGITNIKCPSDAEVKEGSTFKCTGEKDGKTATFSVTIKDGKVAWNLDQ